STVIEPRSNRLPLVVIPTGMGVGVCEESLAGLCTSCEDGQRVSTMRARSIGRGLRRSTPLWGGAFHPLPFLRTGAPLFCVPVSPVKGDLRFEEPHSWCPHSRVLTDGRSAALGWFPSGVERTWF